MFGVAAARAAGLGPIIWLGACRGAQPDHRALVRIGGPWQIWAWTGHDDCDWLHGRGQEQTGAIFVVSVRGRRIYCVF